MADFQHTLIVGIVASILSVLAFLGLTLLLALHWSAIARRVAPNRFPEPASEKPWPASGETTQANLSLPSPVRVSSPSPSPEAVGPQEPPKVVTKEESSPLPPPTPEAKP